MGNGNGEIDAIDDGGQLQFITKADGGSIAIINTITSAIFTPSVSGLVFQITPAANRTIDATAVPLVAD
jgi:hypothetical protein